MISHRWGHANDLIRNWNFEGQWYLLDDAFQMMANVWCTLTDVFWLIPGSFRGYHGTGIIQQAPFSWYHLERHHLEDIIQKTSSRRHHPEGITQKTLSRWHYTERHHPEASSRRYHPEGIIQKALLRRPYPEGIILKGIIQKVSSRTHDLEGKIQKVLSEGII